ncbi:MAG: hypothetical protein AAGK21_03640 [Bacteroidota bacterium]
MRLHLTSAVLLAALAAPASLAQTPDPSASPASGTLTPGADAASVSFDVRADVEMPEAMRSDGCLGFIGAPSPDVVVDWDGGDLRVWVEAAFDATMAVHTPAGDWVCNDDSIGLLPVVDVMGASAGSYAVWLGSFGPDPFESAATLYAGTPPPPPVLNANATPVAGTIDVDGGFEAASGPMTLAVMAGGFQPAAEIDLSAMDDPPFCAGYINADTPAAAVTYDPEGGTGTLAFSATPDMTADLVLVALGPDGQVYCNDDFGSPDPTIVVDSPAGGTYLVWAGTFSPAEDGAATLSVAESADEMNFDGFVDDFGDDFGDDLTFAPYSEGTYTVLDVEATPGLRLTGTAGDAASVATPILPTARNPVQGTNCTGYVELASTVALTLEGEGPYVLTASADSDLVMSVQTPSGGWFCSDDYQGVDPGIQLDGEAGLYRVWVGTFSDLGEITEVTVAVEQGEIEIQDFSMPRPPGREAQSEGIYGGTEIQTGMAAATISMEGAESMSQTVSAGGTILNPVEGSACQGFVSERPTVEIESPTGIEVTASHPEDDLTLVVRGPDGAWTCSDDADGQNPRARVSGAQGTYSVWVGTFSRRTDPLQAELDITPVAEIDIAPAPPPPPPPIRG